MNGEQLFSLLGGLDDRLILAAHAPEYQKGRKRMKSKKIIKIVAVAAALILLFSVGAGAAYRFFLPNWIGEELGIPSDNLIRIVETENAPEGTLSINNKSVETAGYTVTFEAIAEGSRMRTSFLQNLQGANSEAPVSETHTYAIFTIVRADGQHVMYNGDMDGSHIGYGIGLKGYVPNPSSFEQHDYYCYEDEASNVLYMVCDITAALPLADRSLRIAVINYFVPTLEYLALDENGELCLADGYQGLGAVFDLPLDPALADPAAAEALLGNGTFHTPEEFEALMSEFYAENPDLEEDEANADVNAAEPTTAEETSG